MGENCKQLPPQVGHDLAVFTNFAIETWLENNIFLTKLTLAMLPTGKINCYWLLIAQKGSGDLEEDKDWRSII
jgi:hypothetical protein